jgi:hypothetical protein
MIQQDSVKRRMFETEITLGQLCEIAGVPDSKVSPWLRCTKNIGNDMYSAIDETLNDVAALIALVKPIPLDLRNVFLVKELIAKMHKGELEYLRRAKQLADHPQNAAAVETFKTLRPQI